MSKAFIVTGGAGFIGSSLAKRLMSDGAKVYVFDDLSTGFRRNVPRGAVFYKINLANTKLLAAIKIKGPIEAVFHFAGQSSGEASFVDPLNDVDMNYKATYNMLDFTNDLGCKRFVFASSMSVYGEVSSRHGNVKEDLVCSPVSYYGGNKLASEKMIRVFSQQTGMNSTIFRLFNVYGPGQNMNNMKQGMVSIYLSYLMHNQPVLVKGSLNRFRDFVYIDDVCEACLRSLQERKTFGEVLNLGTSRKTTVNELLKVLLRAYGKADFDKWVQVKGNTSGDVTGLTADVGRLRKALNWSPSVHVKEGVAAMKEWLDASVSFWKRK